ncbi:uncharacterized protein LOC126833646 [Adelges cooleyi]|uniref:uncharacterized protein LOC126833646 n=1 Tax=Adelges cooleyi TaxID=133065 RepID=UPI00217F9553|nr:uncharacterized protein LOC126833646 [Adelges cooleyi]
MRAQHDRNKLKPKSYEYVTLNRFHLPDDHEFIDDLLNLEKDNNNIPFSLLTDICVPVSLLLIIVLLGYEMDSMGTDADSTLVLVYGIVLIVATGGACGYVALRMSATQPYRPMSILPAEVKLLSPQKSRSQRYYYQSIPEVHKVGKKRTITFMV